MAIKKNIIWFGAVFIFVILGIAFIFIPSSTGFGKNKTIVFGKWNKKPIEYVQDSYFIRQVQSISDQVRKSGQEINEYMYYEIMHSAFNSTVVRFAILDELNSVKYSAPEAFVNKHLINYYLDENGKYSSILYEQTPETTRISRKKHLSEELTAQRYYFDYFGSQNIMGVQTGLYGIKTSNVETDFIKSMASPERSFSYVSFSTNDYPENLVVDYTNENPEKFLKHNLSMITFESEDTAKRVASSITKQEITFEDAVATYSTHYETNPDGLITNSYAYQLENIFTQVKDLETVLNLDVGETSSIVKAGSTFALVKKDDMPSLADASDDDFVENAKEYILNNEAGIVQDYHFERAKNFVEDAKSSSLALAAKSLDKEVQTTEPFALNYGNSELFSTVPSYENVELSTAANNEQFFNEAFSLEANDISNPIFLDSNIVVLKLVEEKATDQDIVEMIPNFYKSQILSWTENNIRQSFFNSNKLENNFLEVYLKYFIN